MKNKKTNEANILRLLAILAIVAVIGFSTASCFIVPDDDDDYDGGGGGGTPNTSIEGTWNQGGCLISISGTTGVITRLPSGASGYTQSAIDQGYLRVGTTFIRYISKDNNRERTWTGQRLMFEYNTSAPNVCTGTSYSDTGTFTLDSNGKSFVFSSTASDGSFTETYTRY